MSATPVPTARYWCRNERRYLPAANVAQIDNGHFLVRTPDYDPTRGQWSCATLSGHDIVPERCAGVQAEDGQWLYDGDIVDGTGQECWELPSYKCRVIVQWSEDRLRWEAKSPYDSEVWELSDYAPLEYVVGNVRENPSLLPASEEDPS